MNRDIYHFYLPTPEPIGEQQLREAIGRGIDAGWKTTRERDRDECLYTDPENQRYSEWISTDSAIQDLTTRRNGKIRFFLNGNYDFGFGVWSEWSEYGFPGMQGVIVTTSVAQFYSEPATAAAETFDVCRLVYESLDCSFAFSKLPLEAEGEFAVSDTNVGHSELSDLHWLTIFSEERASQIGHESLQTAPVWKSRAIDEGWGFVVTSDPLKYCPQKRSRIRRHLGLS